MISIRSDLALVASTCRSIIEYLPFPIDHYRLELALTEALNNAILYGNKNIEEKQVCIEVLARKSSAIITIKDEGGKLLPEHLGSTNFRNPDALSGRGLGLIAHLVDSIDVISGDLVLTVSSQE